MEQYTTNPGPIWSIPQTAKSQACVRALQKYNLSSEIRKEMEKFISRNILPDCGKVPPNCLKAHLINTAKRFGISHTQLSKLKNSFKAKVGFKGYYLDNGKLMKVNS